MYNHTLLETADVACARKSPVRARALHIAGSGVYLPSRVVFNPEMEAMLGVPAGWVERKTGIRRRHFADAGTESSPFMAARAIEDALREAGGDLPELILCASAIGARPLPATACLVQRELGAAWAGVACMDVNCTCLGFLAAMDLAASHFACGRYRRIVVACAEIASRGINWGDPRSAALFGDAAVAFVFDAEAAEGGDFGGRFVHHAASPALLHCKFATHSEGVDACMVRGGALELPSYEHSERNHADYLFHMDGRRVHELASRHLPGFLRGFLEEAGVTLGDIDWVVPHQAGLLSMRIMQRKLGIPPERFVVTIAEHGNVISASIPLALHIARRAGCVRRGQRVLLVGTAAGLTLGAALAQIF